MPPSQLYVFMPPNLGGFFMVRSYYPSECHADYFDFERIEALKPAIEACGISTLSQSPMLGFHKQMDNRIKLLEAKQDRKSGSAGMPRPISYAVFCLKKKKIVGHDPSVVRDDCPISFALRRLPPVCAALPGC